MAQSFTSNLWHRVAESWSGREFNGSQDQQVLVTPEVGERYAQTSSGSSVWIVDRVMEVASSRYPLVRLTRENHPDLMKIVSISALADKDEFVRAHSQN